MVTRPEFSVEVLGSEAYVGVGEMDMQPTPANKSEGT